MVMNGVVLMIRLYWRTELKEDLGVVDGQKNQSYMGRHNRVTTSISTQESHQ